MHADFVSSLNAYHSIVLRYLITPASAPCCLMTSEHCCIDSTSEADSLMLLLEVSPEWGLDFLEPNIYPCNPVLHKRVGTGSPSLRLL